ETPKEGGDEQGQNARIDRDARTQDVTQDFAPAPVFLHRMLRRIADQSARIAHLVHDLVAAVDAGRATDAFVLQAVADVDAGRAHLHADAAIDAVTQSLLTRVIFLG